MRRCESWTIKKAECQRIDVFKLWYWRRLESPLDSRIKPVVLRKINPEYSLQGLMLKLKLQYFGHLIQRADSLEKTPMLGKIEGRRRRGQLRMRWLDSITNSMMWPWANFRRQCRTEEPGVLQSMGCQRTQHNLVTEQQVAIKDQSEKCIVGISNWKGNRF